MNIRIPDNIYNVLKWIALIAIPAFVTFLSIVLSALNVDPNTVNVICTILTATAGLIGALIGVSTSAYNKEKEEADKIFKAQNGMADAETKEK